MSVNGTRLASGTIPKGDSMDKPTPVDVPEVDIAARRLEPITSDELRRFRGQVVAISLSDCQLIASDVSIYELERRMREEHPGVDYATYSCQR